MNDHVLARQSCIWEVTARKIGNVHPGRAFADTSFHDFISSADCFEGLALDSFHFGPSYLKAVTKTQALVGRNTNLGIIIALVPLLHATSFAELAGIIKSQSVAACRDLFAAIRLANPGGLGSADDQDVHSEPTVTLLEAMTLAADRDLIARQYANNYADVFDLGVPALLEGLEKFGCVEAAIIHCQLKWMSVFPDSLIVRKLGPEAGNIVRQRVVEVLQLGGLETAEGRAAGVALDTYLRSEGNKLNPGTTADLVCACLFVALREGKLNVDAPFPWTAEDWL